MKCLSLFVITIVFIVSVQSEGLLSTLGNVGKYATDTITGVSKKFAGLFKSLQAENFCQCTKQMYNDNSKYSICRETTNKDNIAEVVADDLTNVIKECVPQVPFPGGLKAFIKPFTSFANNYQLPIDTPTQCVCIFNAFDKNKINACKGNLTINPILYGIEVLSYFDKHCAVKG